MKYELLKNNFIEYKGRKLYRIRALKSFSDIKRDEITAVLLVIILFTIDYGYI